MRKPPVHYKDSDDPIFFALSIVNEPTNRERDTAWYRKLEPWILDSLDRITRGEPPRLAPDQAIHAWALCWVIRDGKAVLTRIPDRSAETHRALVGNAIMLLWSDHDRRARLTRCQLEECGRYFFRARPNRETLYCCDQHRSRAANLKRKLARKRPNKVSRRPAASKSLSAKR